MAVGGALELLSNQYQQSTSGGQIAGSVKVYTGPKQGKFIINKHGKKVYIDRKTLNNDVPYLKKKAAKAKKAKKAA
uniref:PBCV-specific basic adaptor domain-containing protein n=1 Tax=viral metagenome TaxID=1070528 RepID=A0A6C0K9Z5_9ZZZZ